MTEEPMRSGTNGRRWGTAAWLMAVLLGAVALAGCGGPVRFEIGRAYDPGLIEESLKIGVSTREDVKRVLGEPYGKGRALMPFHESDRTVWTYYFDQGSVDPSSWKMQDQRRYLFVFLDGERFDGYMWFASTLH
jgi:hypothetical protein